MKNQAGVAILLLLLIIALVAGNTLAETTTVSSATTRNVRRREADGKSAEDGIKCAICVFAVQEVVNNLPTATIPVRALLKKACDALPNDKAKDVCKFVVENYTEELISLLLSKESPDYICTKVNLCHKCHLYLGENFYNDKSVRLNSASLFERVQQRARIVSSMLFHQLKAHPIEPHHVGSRPKIDLDKDWFSSVHTIPRGANWRGRDCNDFSSKVRPGVKESTSGTVDHDCNGIPANYEKKFCSGEYAPKQLINLGDSATAGFMIPVEWLKLQNLSHAFTALLDELDHPDQVWGSGWNAKEGTDSLYLRLRDNNRCIHRQFQNVGKNGGDIFDLSAQIDTVSYGGNNNKPALVTIAYIGNDICQKSLDDMTTPEEFEKKLIEGLNKLDNVLAPGSKVLVFGLVDGSILYDFMGHLEHPIGNNVTYSQFYDFLSCSGVNPCNTWLTSNAKTRAAASARAMELDAVAERVAKSSKFKNYEIGFIDFSDMLDEAFDIVTKQGKPLNSLIDPVDGFHPYVKYGDSVLSSVLWDHISRGYPDFIGPRNPSNDEIEKVFGDQGGY